ncbi:GIY-YIG nuclease family protein [Sporomusa sp.]|uniref:GIY-YIG nuclease family protein n=1 Tax=Sporomusa sp. TaxID=2078658 RepID=UPI002CE505F9|nr:GIY-YIG nuclease family protein [Sporomusa sp.]HWR08512.1 GIY-YIG nuclease family protein [Sporomusa sp.]
MGVYQIKNTITGKLFVGSSMDLPGKFNSNRFQLNVNSHRNKALQEDWNLYGSDAFTFEVLESINPEKIVKDNWRKAVAELEEKWLNTLQPYGEKGYNTPAKQLVANDTTL